MHRALLNFFLIITVLVVIFVFIHNSLLPVFFSLAEVEAVKIANRVINEAIDSEVEGIKYSELINYRMDNNGNIVLMQPNTAEINKFTSRVSLKIQASLEKIKGKRVSIPLFKIIGLEILSAMGPDLPVEIMPVGFTTPPHVKDSIETAGINQTRHKIYLQIDVGMKLIIPFFSTTTVVSADVPVVEVTILGKVPEIYVGLTGEGISGIINN